MSASDSSNVLWPDLAMIYEATRELWPLLDGANIFVTGGTGFIGCWWLEILRYVNTQGIATIKTTLLTRDAEAFKKRWPHLVQGGCLEGDCLEGASLKVSYLEFIEGDIADFDFPAVSFSHILHAATEPSNRYLAEPARLFDTVITGTRRLLEMAKRQVIPPRMLFLSSGAVYGKQPAELERLPESFAGGPDCTNPALAYAEAKRCAEMMCATYSQQYGLPISIARVFTLMGAYMPLNEQFAAGNFMRDALAGRNVLVQGDGRAVRSYLYAADLWIALLNIWLKGPPGRAYNVGSENAISIAGLAELIAEKVGTGQWATRAAPDSAAAVSRYVPDVSQLRASFGVQEHTSLTAAVMRTAEWFRANNVWS